MDKIAFYQPELHNKMISDWYQQWGMNAKDLSVLPNSGIVMENICAIFLYETNSSVCFIDGLISNKEIDKKTRDECLHQVVDQLIKMAYDKGFKYICGYSKYPAVAERAKQHGFKVEDNMYYGFGRT